MQKIVIFLMLIHCSSYPMHIERIEKIADEKTPLIIKKEKDFSPQSSYISAHCQNSAPTYLDRLPSEIRYQVSCYLKPDAPAMQPLLDKISLQPEQAKELYKKFFINARSNLLLTLIKNKEAQKLIKKAREEQQKEVATICNSAQSIIKEDDAADKMLLFMSQNAIPLETLEEITIRTLPHVQEQVAMSEAISIQVESLIEQRERYSKIASGVSRLHASGGACYLNFCGGACILGALAVWGLIYTHWPIDGVAMMDCVHNQYSMCYNDFFNHTTSTCSKIINDSWPYGDCCRAFADAYCNSWNYNISRAFPRENLQAWTPFIITSSLFIGLQLISVILSCTRKWRTVDTQTKEVVQRYHNKIKELRVEEV
jgi:hypothetical protein